MVLNMVGPSLEALFGYCHSQFSLKTLCQLALQAIAALKAIHEKGVIHRGLHLSNLAMGSAENPGQMFLLDFGEAGHRLDPAALKIAHDEGAKGVGLDASHGLVGHRRFAPLAAHDHLEQSECDDLESLCYVLLYLTAGYLPWSMSWI